MKTVIAGGSGFIGSAIVEAFLKRGEVVVLSRDASKVRRGRGVNWHPPSEGEWVEEVEDADVVINLAGASIGEARWTEARKRELLTSRVDPTGALVNALQRSVRRERLLVSASAVGIYGDRGDEILAESADAGKGFLSDLASRWEGEAKRAREVARVVILRFGVVIDREGGMVKKLLLPFKLGGGAVLGDGRQWMSWLSRHDAVSLVEWVVSNERAGGVYNATSPEPVTNRQFTRQLAKAVHRPAFLKAPAPALRLALGEMADQLLLASQRAVPTRAESEGFRFTHPMLEQALAATIG